MSSSFKSNFFYFIRFATKKLSIKIKSEEQSEVFRWICKLLLFLHEIHFPLLLYIVVCYNEWRTQFKLLTLLTDSCREEHKILHKNFQIRSHSFSALFYNFYFFYFFFCCCLVYLILFNFFRFKFSLIFLFLLLLLFLL